MLVWIQKYKYKVHPQGNCYSDNYACFDRETSFAGTAGAFYVAVGSNEATG